MNTTNNLFHVLAAAINVNTEGGKWNVFLISFVYFIWFDLILLCVAVFCATKMCYWNKHSNNVIAIHMTFSLLFYYAETFTDWIIFAVLFFEFSKKGRKIKPEILGKCIRIHHSMVKLNYTKTITNWICNWFGQFRFSYRVVGSCPTQNWSCKTGRTRSINISKLHDLEIISDIRYQTFVYFLL